MKESAEQAPDMQPLVSMIITSYNYDRYLGFTIDSCLRQSYPECEIIVVDDGSTDTSRNVIGRYQDKVKPIFKANGGQGSAFNAGFAASRGDIVMFVDSDDLLAESAAAAVRAVFTDPAVFKAHWPLWIIDGNGEKTGQLMEPHLPDGDFRELVAACGPHAEHASPNAPTSGNAFRRSFLARVLPMNEPAFLTNADSFLCGLAPAFGTVRTIATPIGFYRIHGENAHIRSFEQNMARGLASYAAQCVRLQELLQCDNDAVEEWKKHGWWSRIGCAMDIIRQLVPEGRSFILCDHDAWGTSAKIFNRLRIPFIAHNGEFWGDPEDDAQAIAELEKYAGLGATHLFLAWPTFWWLDYYRGFASYLAARFPCVFKSSSVLAYDLHPVDGRG